MSHWKDRLIRAQDTGSDLEAALNHDDFLMPDQEGPPDHEVCDVCNGTGVRSYHALPGPYGSEPCSFCDPNRDPNEE